MESFDKSVIASSTHHQNLVDEEYSQSQNYCTCESVAADDYRRKDELHHGDGVFDDKRPSEPSIDSRAVPLLNRIGHLEIVISCLEERKRLLNNCNGDGDRLSPKSELEKRCKPINSVLLETEAKGTIIERVQSLENKVMEISEQLERLVSVDKSDGFSCKEDGKAEAEEQMKKGIHDMAWRRKPNIHVDIPSPNYADANNSYSDRVAASVKESSKNITLDSRVSFPQSNLNGTMSNNNKPKGKHSRLKYLFCMLPVSYSN